MTNEQLQLLRQLLDQVYAEVATVPDDQLVSLAVRLDEVSGWLFAEQEERNERWGQ